MKKWLAFILVIATPRALMASKAAPKTFLNHLEGMRALHQTAQKSNAGFLADIPTTNATARQAAIDAHITALVQTFGQLNQDTAPEKDETLVRKEYRVLAQVRKSKAQQIANLSQSYTTPGENLPDEQTRASSFIQKVALDTFYIEQLNQLIAQASSEPEVEEPPVAKSFISKIFGTTSKRFTI